MLKRYCVFFTLLCGLSYLSYSQCFIGLDKTESEKMVKTKLRGFQENNMIVKRSFNYLKYENDNEQAIIIFFDDKNKCMSTQQINSYESYDVDMDSLNAKYKKAGLNQWEYIHNNIPIIVSMTKTEMFYTISTKIKPK